MTVLQALIKDIDANWEKGENHAADLIRMWAERDLKSEELMIKNAEEAGYKRCAVKFGENVTEFLLTHLKAK